MKLDKENSIIIKKVENGYILQTFTWEDTQENNKVYREEVEVIEEEGDINSDKKALGRVLDKIAEWAGFHYDKYGKENLRISWDKKGHKLDLKKER